MRACPQQKQKEHFFNSAARTEFGSVTRATPTVLFLSLKMDAFPFLKITFGDWRDGSAVQNTGYFCRKIGFSY